MRVECFYYFHDYYEVKSNTSTSSRGNCKSKKVKLKRHFLDFCNMVDISDMLFIVGHVGHIWRSWETKLYETITRSKVFEVQSFRENFFLGRY